MLFVYEYNSLTLARYTPEGNTGFVKLISFAVPFQGAARKRHFCPLPGHRYPKATDTKVSVKVQTQNGSNEPLTSVIIICEGAGLGDLEKDGVIAPSKHVHFYLCVPQGLLD